MEFYGRKLVALTFAGALTVGCGSSTDTGNGKGASTGACDPNADIPCIAGIAEPCVNFHTDYEGDEYCLKPPSPNAGYQLHVGPKDYTNPDDVKKYLAPAGSELNWAEVQTMPNDTPVYTDGYYSSMRPGSHHFILFGLPAGTSTPATNGPMTNGSGTESAVGALGGEFLAGATRQLQNAIPNSDYPEDQGIGTETKANAQMALNLHFINTTDHPRLQEIWVNFRLIDESKITRWAHAITWYGGLMMNIPPGQHYILDSQGSVGSGSSDGKPAACGVPADAANVRILGVTGHVHANTIQYNATMIRNGEKTVLFQDYDWHDPLEFRYNRATTNGTPDAAKKTPGGYTGLLNLQTGDQFAWQCEGQNQSTVNLTFSNQVYKGEMCNVFGFYATDTKDAKPWLCAFF